MFRFRKSIIYIVSFLFLIFLVSAEEKEFSFDVNILALNNNTNLLVSVEEQGFLIPTGTKNLTFSINRTIPNQEEINQTFLKSVDMCVKNYSAELSYTKELADLSEGLGNLRQKLNDSREESEFLQLEVNNKTLILNDCLNLKQSQEQNLITSQNSLTTCQTDLKSKESNLIFGILIGAGAVFFLMNQKKKPQEKNESVNEGVLQ